MHSRSYAALPLRTGDGVHFDAAAGFALIGPQPPAKVLLVASGETTDPNLGRADS